MKIDGNNIRVSVTDLEAFRLFREEDWMSFDDLMMQSTGEEPQSLQMAASGVFHEILSHLHTGEHDVLRKGRFTFDLADVEADIVLQPLRELRVSRQYVLDDGTVIDVRGRVDGADGVAVDDHKIKFGSYDAERQADSVQWRFYLDMTGSRIFRYNTFEAKDFTDKEKERWARCPCAEYVHCGGIAGECASICTCGRRMELHLDEFEITIKTLHIHTLYDYEGMHEELIAHLRDYATFARARLTDAAILAWREKQDRSYAYLDPGK